MCDEFTEIFEFGEQYTIEIYTNCLSVRGHQEAVGQGPACLIEWACLRHDFHSHVLVRHCASSALLRCASFHVLVGFWLTLLLRRSIQRPES